MRGFWTGLALGFLWGWGLPDLLMWLLPGVVP